MDSIKCYLSLIGSGVSDENIFEIVDEGQTLDIENNAISTNCWK